LGDASVIYATVDLINNYLNPDEISILSFNPNYDVKYLELPSNVQVLPSPAREAPSIRQKIEVISDMFIFLVWALFLRIGIDISCVFSRNRQKVAEVLRGADLVIIRGSDTLTDIYGIRSITLNLFNIFLSLFIRRKTVALSHSIGPFKTRIWRILAAKLLRKIDCFAVRDKYSRELLEEMGIPSSKVHLLPDIAFMLPPKKTRLPQLMEMNPQQLHVGLIPSALVWRFLAQDEKETRYVSYISLFSRIIDYLVETYKASVILIPHVLYWRADDRKTAQDIYKNVRNKEKTYIYYDYNPRKVKYVISRLDFLISPRMHPIVHALSTGVPVIGIDYNMKIKELMKSFALEEFVIDINELDFEKLKSKIDKVVLELDSLRNRVIKAKNSMNMKLKGYRTLLIKLLCRDNK